MMQPLQGIRVLDFSTLLPGPMCTLMLAEAGAEVIKLERPAGGDEMRSYEPKFDADSVNFALLNRGKKSVAVDLKSPGDKEKVLALVRDADVLVEQFRPGVMARLGLGYEALEKINPGLVYCSITAYGQNGPKALTAAHDLNFQAETGMLALTCDDHGAPVLPPTLTGDLAGGTYPAMLNILLALRQRDLTGHGQHLDVSMADNLFTLMYWGLGNGWTAGQWPRPGGDLVTGGTPRYAIYRCSDNQYLAAAPLEDKFWRNFLTLLGAPELLQETDDTVVRQTIAGIIGSQPAAHWEGLFAGQDVCTVRVVSLEEAVKDPHFVSRGLFSRTVTGAEGQQMPALPMPIADTFRAATPDDTAPALGKHTRDTLG